MAGVTRSVRWDAGEIVVHVVERSPQTPTRTLRIASSVERQNLTAPCVVSEAIQQKEIPVCGNGFLVLPDAVRDEREELHGRPSVGWGPRRRPAMRHRPPPRPLIMAATCQTHAG